MGIGKAFEKVLETVTGDDDEVMGKGYLAPPTDETVGEPATQGLAQEGVFTLSPDPDSAGAPPLDESRETVLPASENPRECSGDTPNPLADSGIAGSSDMNRR